MQHPALWFSHSRLESHGLAADGRGCLLSVVLDAGCQHHFSAIRLIITSKDLHPNLRDVVSRDCCPRGRSR